MILIDIPLHVPMTAWRHPYQPVASVSEQWLNELSRKARRILI